jgi:prepilin-type N-terminal cleavage/methylation domain-containing protein
VLVVVETMVSLTHKKNGYTFTELLIVSVIVAMLLISGVAGYRRFENTQQVNQAAQEFIAILRSAQKDAGAGEGAAGCTGPPVGLTGYQVTTGSVIRVCEDTSASNVKNFTLKNGVSLYGGPVTFSSKAGGIVENVNVDFTVGGSLVVRVSPGGAISIVSP